MLALSIQRGGAVIELGLSGDLDMATAPRLREAMAWLRFSSEPATTIVIDTTDVDFIAAAGYRALQAALVGPNGLWDPRVVLIVGPAVARLEAAISAARPPARGAPDARHPAPGGR
jgi:anti-anti-sigma factor